MVFVKGDKNINRDGRPEGTFSLLTLLKKELQKCPEGEDERTYADLIIKKMLDEATKKGDYNKMKLIWNYIEGMPLQKLANADGSNLMPQPILNVQPNNSDNKDTEDESEDKDNTGGNIG